MHARTTNITLQLACVLDGVAHYRVFRILCLLQLGNCVDRVCEVDLEGLILVGRVLDSVRNEFAESVTLRERQLLHSCHILQRHLGSHRTIGDDVRHLLLSILLGHPIEHSATTFVVEVDIDIGQRDTVRVEESLEQQVVLDRVNLRDSQAVCHCRTRCRTTTRAYPYAQLLACGTDKVLHDKEVARETHRLHNVELEAQTLRNLLREWCAISLLGTLHSEFCEVVGLELYAVELVVSSKLFDLLFGCLLVHHNLAILVASELVEEILLGKACAVLLLGAEVGRDREYGHNWCVVNRVTLDLVADGNRILQSLGV